MIKGIICDLDGAYFSKGRDEFIETLILKYKLDSDKLKTVFFSSEQMASYKRGQISDEEFWNFFIRDFDLTVTANDLLRLLADCYQEDENIKPFMIRLKEKGFQTIICSNNFRSRVNTLEDKFHFLVNFSTSIFSYEVGKLKLEGTAMFDEVLKKSALSADEIFMFDNGAENIAKAKAYGFAAEIYTNYLNLLEKFKEYQIII